MGINVLMHMSFTGEWKRFISMALSYTASPNLHTWSNCAQTKKLIKVKFFEFLSLTFYIMVGAFMEFPL